MNKSVTHKGNRRRALAGVLILMLSATACSSGEVTPDLGPPSTGSASETEGETPSDPPSDPPTEGKSPEEIAQEIEDALEVRDPELVVAGTLKSGPSVFPAELAVLDVEASDSSTRLVIALRSTSGEEETLDLAAFNQHTPLLPGIRDVSVTDPTTERILMPFLAFPEGKDPLTSSFCMCSNSPKTLNDAWFTLYATVPALAAETSAVTVTVPGFEPVADVPVARD